MLFLAELKGWGQLLFGFQSQSAGTAGHRRGERQ